MINISVFILRLIGFYSQSPIRCDNQGLSFQNRYTLLVDAVSFKTNTIFIQKSYHFHTCGDYIIDFHRR